MKHRRRRSHLGRHEAGGLSSPRLACPSVPTPWTPGGRLDGAYRSTVCAHRPGGARARETPAWYVASAA